MILLDFIRYYNTKKVVRDGYDVVEVFPHKFMFYLSTNRLIPPIKDHFLTIEDEFISFTINTTPSCSYIVLGMNKKIGTMLINKQIKVLDIEEIREQDDSYLLLKYGKLLLEEVDDV